MNQNHKHLFGRPGETSVHCTPGRPIHLEKAMDKVEKRFWSKVEKGQGCWNWKDYKNYGGYGRFWIKYKTFQAHRVSYEMVIGSIPVGLQIDHLCRNRMCVNPSHLEPVTQKENLRRGINHHRIKTHCIRGHEFTYENIYKRKDGGRSCKLCTKMHDKMRILKKRVINNGKG